MLENLPSTSLRDLIRLRSGTSFDFAQGPASDFAQGPASDFAQGPASDFAQGPSLTALRGLL